MFSTLPEKRFNFSFKLILSSVNAFKLDQSKIFSFGKELTLRATNEMNRNFQSRNMPKLQYCGSFSLYYTISILTLYQSKILSFGKKLKQGLCGTQLTISQTSPVFLRVCSSSLLKTQWEKEKLLITSNFSFSHSVFLLISARFLPFS